METGDLHISVARVRVTGSASVLVSVADSDACGLVACTASAFLILCARTGGERSAAGGVVGGMAAGGGWPG